MIEVACVAETMALVMPDPPHPLSSGGPLPLDMAERFSRWRYRLS
jgi:hypothetical protein